MIKTLISVLLLSITFPLFSQKVTGRAIDVISKKPISNAIIVVEKSRELTTSNYSGFFQCNADSGDVITIKAIGYETSLIKIPSQNSFKVGLTRSVEEEIFTIVEEPATPTNGHEAFFKSIRKRLDCQNHDSADTMLITFTIDLQGALKVRNILNSSEGNCIEHITQVLETSSKWNPAKQRNQKVKQKFELLLIRQRKHVELRFLPVRTDTLWFRLFRNFFPASENLNAIEPQRFYVFVDIGEGIVKNTKLLNHNDSKIGNFFQQVISNAPYRLFADLNPSQSQMIIPISFKFHEKQTFQDNFILPEGELIDELTCIIRKN